MRPDVKLGIVVSAVFVTVAGTYFLVQDRQESAIPVSSDPAALAGTDDKTTPSAAKPVSRNPPTRTASRRNSATAPSGNQRTHATTTRDRRASRPEQWVAGTDTKRGTTTPAAQQRRTRSGREPQRKQPRRKQPKPQLALTATPATGAESAIERHRVQQGDTMASLAKQYYGSTQFTAFLTSRNKQLADPTQPRVGEVVNIVPRPTDGKPRAKEPATVTQQTPTPATREYRVKSGDSFYRIARDVLGDATRWNELFLMNKKLVGDDPTKLQIGQVIALPKK